MSSFVVLAPVTSLAGVEQDFGSRKWDGGGCQKCKCVRKTYTVNPWKYKGVFVVFLHILFHRIWCCYAPTLMKFALVVLWEPRRDSPTRETAPSAFILACSYRPTRQTLTVCCLFHACINGPSQQPSFSPGGLPKPIMLSFEIIKSNQNQQLIKELTGY